MGLKSEDEVMQLIRIEAAVWGIVLMRNNSGVLKNERGTPIRFGLMNESKKQNATIKSSDLLGPMPPNGRLICVEVKEEGWQFNPKNEREVAQLNFINFMKSKGAVAGFCSSVEDFLKLIGKI